MTEFRIEGVEGLDRDFERISRKVFKAAKTGLARAGMTVIADAQQALRTNGTNSTGLLSNSGKVQEINGEDALDVGFFAKSGRGYAEYVEYGRRAGKMPPLKNIIEWARKKLRISGKAVQSAGYLIARKIAQKGTRPQPFFRPALERNSQAIERVISAAVASVTGGDRDVL